MKTFIEAINQFNSLPQYGLPRGQSRCDMIQQKIRENLSEKLIVVNNERQSPTPFSFCDITGLSPQINQTGLQERQAIIVEQFDLEQYPESASQQTYVDIFVGNMLRLAKSNYYGNIAEQCELLQKIVQEKNFSAEDVLCSLCCKNKFDYQKNKFAETGCRWPILPLIAQRARLEFLYKFIEAIYYVFGVNDSVFGVEIIKKMMLVKSDLFNDTALSAAVAKCSVKSVSFLLELSEKLGLIEHLIDWAPNFGSLNTFVKEITKNKSKKVSKIEAMALFYMENETNENWKREDYKKIAEIVHEKYIELKESETNKPETNKPENVLKGNKFAILATWDNVE